ncbi:polyferredoxin [Desulfobaculum xiamenense]|uniref:Polyferredoxin n=1 Tax=Desulfobaculum xiamenense TaxID=995050 RepID=A0A846QQM7_9BACT|nr:4Fe-4S binding protein [Desulfobaculum xiamenense]NJB68802.1 polyferredoxin [Desulfobaculum xiamenense]
MDIRHLSKAIMRPSRVRLAVQFGCAALCLYAGWRFYLFTSWAAGHTTEAVARPASVEAFLPLSAFMALKRLLVTGLWDAVHPAGLTILIMAIVMALVVRKGFCGHICPVGLASRMLAAAGRRLGISHEPPRWMHKGLFVFKYMLFAPFALTVLRMGVPEIESFLFSSYNISADAHMLAFFLYPSTATLIVVTTLALLGLVVPYFWCRYMCPYGAMLGLFSLASPLAITRDASACTGCGRCSRVCPGGIRVQEKVRVNSPECVGCMQCVEACPAKGCLAPALPVVGRLNPLLPALAAALLLAGFHVWGVSTGHWDSTMPLTMLRRFYAMALSGMPASGF